MHHRSVDIFTIVALTLCTVALAFVTPGNNLVGHIWTLPLVLLFPGYALTSALFVKETFGRPERLIFSLGLSLTTVVLGGLVLNWTPFGLNVGSWAVFLGGMTVSASTIALLRRREQSGHASAWLGIGRIGFTFRQGLLLGSAIFIVCGAVAISIFGVERQPTSGFTELWLLPTSGASAKNTIRSGMKNMELTAMEYRLVINLNSKVVKTWPSIDLKPNNQWETTLMLPQTARTKVERVEAVIYRADAPTKIYRHVFLWLST